MKRNKKQFADDSEISIVGSIVFVAVILFVCSVDSIINAIFQYFNI